jgi:hypothetical protein
LSSEDFLTTISYDLPSDVFEEGEKRPERDRRRRPKKGTPDGADAKNRDSPATDVTLESRKRKTETTASDTTSISKKPNVNSTELNGSFKRALDTEVCGPHDTKVKHLLSGPSPSSGTSHDGLIDSIIGRGNEYVQEAPVVERDS